MIILLMLISVGIFVYSIFTDDEELGCMAIGGFIIKLIALLILTWFLVECRVINSKIELYENKNKEIESKVEVVVKEYMQHENNTFKELKTNESYITLVTLYPELKSDELIKKEIEIYEQNNDKIIGLKEQKINEFIYKWWIYFGK